MKNEVTKILEVHEIWPETEVAVLLLLASSKSNRPFVIWAERKSDQSILISNKYFDDEVEAKRSFKLLTDVLVELNDPLISLLKEIPANDPQ